jgi:nucleoside-diphosphate-sugar epimerase
MEFDNLITDPFGFGERLILELLKRGESVFAIFPSPKDVPMSFLGKRNIKYGFAKFGQDPAFHKNLPKRIKHVFHNYELYVGSLTRMFKSNVLTTLLLLDWAKNIGVESFTYLSSGEVYGKGNSLDEKSSYNAHGFYATTKYQAEMLLKFYGRSFRIQTVRLFFPFGKGIEQGFAWNLVQSVISGQAIETEYGLFSPTFGDDIVEPLIKIRDEKGSTICNICGSPVKVEQFVEEVKSVVQKSPKQVIPGKTTLTGKNTCAREQLGYRETALQEAISHSFSTLK